MQTRNKGEINDTLTPAANIARAFEHASNKGCGVLIPYFMCGYPSRARSIVLALAGAQAGADIIELGVPYPDPIADGPTIRHAGHIALEGGMNMDGCMELAREVSARSTVPLVLMSYYNHVLAYGIDRCCRKAAASGVCGLIVPDLPLAGALPFQQVARRYGLSLVFVVAPNMSDEHIAYLCGIAASASRNFIYCASHSGVTGAHQTLPADLSGFITRVRRCMADHPLPLVIGFGLSTPEHIAEVTGYAEGAVVGSAIIDLIKQYEEREQPEVVKGYIRSLCQATRHDDLPETEIVS